MEDEYNVLFVRSNGSSLNDSDEGLSSDDVWDDTALLKAYDQAMDKAKKEVARRMLKETIRTTESTGAKESTDATKKKPEPQKQNQQPQKSQKQWCVGAPCQAVYSEDGKLYEAIITKIFDNNRNCIVKFIGYNNRGRVELSSLRESEGLENQVKQQKEAMECKTQNPMEFEEVPKMSSSMDCETNESYKSTHIPGSTGESPKSPFDGMPPGAPVPPQFMARLPENDADALSSMLMSWYISGFHTGFYQGLKQAQKNPKNKKQ